MRIRRFLLALALAAGLTGTGAALTAAPASACQPDGPCGTCPKDVVVKGKTIIDWHCPY